MVEVTSATAPGGATGCQAAMNWSANTISGSPPCSEAVVQHEQRDCHAGISDLQKGSKYERLAGHGTIKSSQPGMGSSSHAMRQLG